MVPVRQSRFGCVRREGDEFDKRCQHAYCFKSACVANNEVGRDGALSFGWVHYYIDYIIYIVCYYLTWAATIAVVIGGLEM